MTAFNETCFVHGVKLNHVVFFLCSHMPSFLNSIINSLKGLIKTKGNFLELMSVLRSYLITHLLKHVWIYKPQLSALRFGKISIDSTERLNKHEWSICEEIYTMSIFCFLTSLNCVYKHQRE